MSQRPLIPLSRVRLPLPESNSISLSKTLETACPHSNRFTSSWGGKSRWRCQHPERACTAVQCGSLTFCTAPRSNTGPVDLNTCLHALVLLCYLSTAYFLVLHCLKLHWGEGILVSTVKKCGINKLWWLSLRDSHHWLDSLMMNYFIWRLSFFQMSMNSPYFIFHSPP